MCVQVCVCISSGLALLVFLAFPALGPQLANSASQFAQGQPKFATPTTAFTYVREKGRPCYPLSLSHTHLNAFREFAFQSGIFLWPFVIRGPSKHFGQLYVAQLLRLSNAFPCSQSIFTPENVFVEFS